MVAKSLHSAQPWDVGIRSHSLYPTRSTCQQVVMSTFLKVYYVLYTIQAVSLCLHHSSTEMSFPSCNSFAHQVSETRGREVVQGLERSTMRPEPCLSSSRSIVLTYLCESVENQYVPPSCPMSPFTLPCCFCRLSRICHMSSRVKACCRESTLSLRNR